MTGIKKLLKHMIFLMILQKMIGLVLSVAHAVDFLDSKAPQGVPVLKRDTKIPVGFAGSSIHYITLLKGVPLSEIPLKVSQKREEVGLSPDIPIDEQNKFFKDFPWKIAKDIFLTSPIPGRVVQINVQQGQQVATGETIGIIECMKMFHTISAGSQGEIRDIFFKAGDMVGQWSNLVSYAPPSPNWEDVDQEKILESKDLLIFLFSWSARSSPASPQVPPNWKWEHTRHSEFLENKDVMILLYPWMRGSSSTSSDTPLPPKGAKSDVLTTRAGSENNQQALMSPGPLPPSAQNSVLGRPDQDHKVGNGGGAKVLYEKTERQPSVLQDNATAFQQQRIQGDEFKDTSGISMVAWTHWVCGLVVLSKLSFALKSLGYSLLRRVKLKKYTLIVAAFPRTAYVCANDFNKHPLVKSQTAHNMNRFYFGGRKCA